MKEYQVEIKKKGPGIGASLYFIVETYYQNTVPTDCTTGIYQHTNIIDREVSDLVQYPVLYYAIFKND